MIEEGGLQQHLQQITGSEALAPLLLNLLGQNVPNWQQQQQQYRQQHQPATNQPQQPQAQFFVYNKNSPAGSQQPPVLAAFNGVNVQPEQQQLLLAQAPAEAQYPATPAEGPKIVKAPPAAAVWAPESRHPGHSPGTTITTVMNHPHHLNGRPRTETQIAGTQPLPPPHPMPLFGGSAVPASCPEDATPPGLALSCAPTSPPATSYETIPLLSATALKAAVG
nr:immediate early response gene 5-like protein [Drosophila bipectinata]